MQIQPGLQLQPKSFSCSSSISQSVSSLILSSILSASLWSMLLLGFCECTDGERAHPKEPRKGFWWSPWHWVVGSCLSPATWHCSGPLTLSKQLRGRGTLLMGSQETLFRLTTLNPRDCHAALTSGARCFSVASCEPTEMHMETSSSITSVLSQKKSRRASGSAAQTPTKQLLRAQI